MNFALASIFRQSRCGIVAPVVALLLLAVSGRGDAPASPAAALSDASALLPAGAFKAVFVDDPAAGRDPFFPHSRRPGRIPTQVDTTNVLSQSAVLFAQIAVKGISHSRERRLAIINNVTMAVGEKAELSLEAQRVTVRCLEIRDRSVLLSIDGVKDPREIEFREPGLPQPRKSP